MATQKQLALDVLKQKQEDEFLQGIKALPWYKEFVQQYGGPPNLDDKQYDYRKAWAQGIRPERSPHDKQFHWPSKTRSGEWLKAQDHPTAWKELYFEQTGRDPDVDGITEQQWLQQRR